MVTLEYYKNGVFNDDNKILTCKHLRPNIYSMHSDKNQMFSIIVIITIYKKQLNFDILIL